MDEIFYSPQLIENLILTQDEIYISSQNTPTVVKLNGSHTVELSVSSQQEKLVYLTSKETVISWYANSFSTSVDFPNNEESSFDVDFVSTWVKYNESTNTLAFVSAGGKVKIYKVLDWTLFKEIDFNAQIIDFYNLGHVLILVTNTSDTFFYLPQFDHLNNYSLVGHEFICSDSNDIVTKKNGMLYVTNIYKEYVRSYVTIGDIVYRFSDTYGLCCVFDNKLFFRKINGEFATIPFTYNLPGIIFVDIYNQSIYTKNGIEIIRHLFNVDSIYPGERIAFGDWWDNIFIDHNTQSIVVWNVNKIAIKKLHELYEILLDVPFGLQKNANLNKFSVGVFTKLRNRPVSKKIYLGGSNASPSSPDVICDGYKRLGFTNDNDSLDKVVTAKI